MHEIEVLTSEGRSTETVYTVHDFPEACISYCPTVRKKKINYINSINAFDIETTTIEGKTAADSFSFMHTFQVALNETTVIFGHTWEEFTELLNKLRKTLNLSYSNRLVFYVHNLAYEFQFMKDFITINNMFSKAKRRPLYIHCDGIEFRCSYFLTNMSLAEFSAKTPGVKYLKNSGDDYDYEKLRYPDTPQTMIEQSYEYCDVRGLCEGLRIQFFNDHTIADIPLTSTGFVRSDCREAMKKNPANREKFLEKALTLTDYKLCREAFRGGNCHANRKHAGKKLSNIHSYDETSAYIAAMFRFKYPSSQFREIEIKTEAELLLYSNKYCLVMEIDLFDLEIKDSTPIPYIDYSHCKKVYNSVNDNGRVLRASYIKYTCTNVDFEIIKRQYNIEKITVCKCIYAEKDYLPIEFLEKVLSFFDGKTKLKNVDPLLYMKSKNKLNATYGMMVTDILNQRVEYIEGKWTISEDSEDRLLEKYYNSRNSFLSYQDGVFVTAYARHLLQQPIDRIGDDVVYVDTDSVKYIGEHEDVFNDLNSYIDTLKNTLKIRISSKDNDGNEYTLGIWEREPDYLEFKTLGAKKYAYTTAKHGFGITIAGVNKTDGAVIIGTIDNFKLSSVYKNKTIDGKKYRIGRTDTHYTDIKPQTVTIDGHTFTTASYISIVDSEYTMKITKEYLKLIKNNLQ